MNPLIAQEKPLRAQVLSELIDQVLGERCNRSCRTAYLGLAILNGYGLDFQAEGLQCCCDLAGDFLAFLEVRQDAIQQKAEKENC